MKENQGEIRKAINFSISNDVLSCSKLDIDEIKEYFSELVFIFKDDFIRLFPTKIKDNTTLDAMARLGDNLRKLKHCKGLEKHIQNFENDGPHFSFVTMLSGFLVTKVDKLVLEPSVEKKSKQPDIFISLDSEETYIECKTFDFKHFNYYQEHRHIFDILKEYIHYSHQVDITYTNSLSDEEIKEIGKTLQNRLDKVTNTGRIINNNDLEVHVRKKDEYENLPTSIAIEMIQEHSPWNRSNPGHIFFEKGLTISISGPRVDITNILMNKIKDSRDQSAPEKPFILAIDANNMLGDYKENFRRLSTSFQPDINTRFSAILLIKYTDEIDARDLKFNIISNPFAKYPVSDTIKILFPLEKF